MNKLIANLKLHWPVILSALTSVYAVLVNAGVINTSNKTVATVIAVVSTIVYTVFHVRLLSTPTVTKK
jgi:uncharacterized membrane protein YGL010W